MVKVLKSHQLLLGAIFRISSVFLLLTKASKLVVIGPHGASRIQAFLLILPPKLGAVTHVAIGNGATLSLGPYNLWRSRALVDALEAINRL